MGLYDQIMRKLSDVIDPETGLSVVRMGLIHDLSLEQKTGKVHLVFRPTSYFCPLAFKLAGDIQNAIQEIVDVSAVTITVEDFARAKDLNRLLANSQE